MFRRLCGNNNFGNVVLGTTFWSKVSQAVGQRREQELETSNEMWGSMVSKGSRLVRVKEDRSSNLTILENIAQNNGKVVIEAQQEMASGKSRAQTSVALDVTKALAEYRQQQQLEEYRESQRLALEEKTQARARKQALANLQYEANRQRRLAKEAADAEAQRQKERVEAVRQARLKEERKERERQKAEADRLERVAAEARKAQRARAKEEALYHYYTNYRCDETSTYRRLCDMCGVRLHKHRSHYWHCCFCDGDNYNTCSSCGPVCRDSSHPYMKRISTIDDSECILM